MSSTDGTPDTETRRLFLAIVPGRAESEALHRYAAAQPCAGGRQTAARNLHLTLAFLGDVPLARIPALVEALGGVPFEPFTLTFDRCGVWHGGLLWVGCRSVPAGLASLVVAIRDALRGLGLPVERRPFQAHVTLWRKLRHAGSLAQPAMSWRCAGFALMASSLSPDGAQYTCLCRFPRGQAAIVGAGGLSE